MHTLPVTWFIKHQPELNYSTLVFALHIHIVCVLPAFIIRLVYYVHLDCELSLFSQSSLSSAGLERSSFLLSLASLDFLACVTILRDCAQSNVHCIKTSCRCEFPRCSQINFDRHLYLQLFHDKVTVNFFLAQ